MPCWQVADSTQLGGADDSLEAGEALQRGLDRLVYWAMICGLKFSKSKCRVLHLGWSNIRYKYKLGQEGLESSRARRDLRVLAGSSSVRVSSVCPDSQEGKLHPGVHLTQHHQPVKRSDYLAVFDVGAASPVLGPTI